nr:hypothetical protein [Fredinandcohnia onubensis]
MYNGLPILSFLLMIIGIALIFNLNSTKAQEMYTTLKERRAQN